MLCLTDMQICYVDITYICLFNIIVRQVCQLNENQQKINTSIFRETSQNQCAVLAAKSFLQKNFTITKSIIQNIIRQ